MSLKNIYTNILQTFGANKPDNSDISMKFEMRNISDTIKETAHEIMNSGGSDNGANQFIFNRNRMKKIVY